jgi:glycosyltransferase involved in cell wall biosynthesis
VIRQVVEEADAGIAVCPGSAAELAEAVRSLADQPELGREMGKRGRAAVEARFSRRILAEKLALLMEDMRTVRG